MCTFRFASVNASTVISFPGRQTRGHGTDYVDALLPGDQAASHRKNHMRLSLYLSAAERHSVLSGEQLCRIMDEIKTGI